MMMVGLAMALPAPEWISFEAEKTEGSDLLGLRAPVQRIRNSATVMPSPTIPY
jgi:hypothetical protein